MTKCLRIMGLCVSLSVFVACGPDDQTPLTGEGAGPIVECPCNYHAIPTTAECWVTPFPNTDLPIQFFLPTATLCVLAQFDEGFAPPHMAQMCVEQAGPGDFNCFIELDGLPPGCGARQFDDTLTQEEFEACQCEIQAYATALNDVAGISVSGGPPYICSPVECASRPANPEP